MEAARNFEERFAYHQQCDSNILWRLLKPGQTDETDVYCILHHLLRLSQEISISSLFKEGTTQKLVRLLKEDHTPPVYSLIILLICLASNARSTIKTEIAQDSITLRCLMNLVSVGYKRIDTFGPDEACIFGMLEYASNALAFFSCGPPICQECLIFEHAINIMSKIIDIENNSVGFRHSKRGMTHLCSLVYDKNLVGSFTEIGSAKDVDPMFAEKIGVKADHARGLVFNELYDTSSDMEDDIDIIDSMAKKSHLWILTPREEDDTDIWRDVHVTSVVDSQHFWAHVGTDVDLKTPSRISDRINKYPADRKIYLREPPAYGTIVCAQYEDKFIRAIVNGSSDEENIWVFAIDYGFPISVKLRDVFVLSKDMGITEPAQAIYCKIGGAVAPPTSKTLIRNSLKVLINLSKTVEGLKASLFAECETLPRAISLCNCPDREIQISALQLCRHLCCDDNLRSKARSFNLGQILINVLHQNSHRRKEMAEILELAALALLNFIYGKSENKDLILKEQGIHVVFHLISEDVDQPPMIRGAALKLLRIFSSQDKAASSVNGSSSRKRFVNENKSAKSQPVSNRSFGSSVCSDFEALDLGEDRTSRSRGSNRSIRRTRSMSTGTDSSVTRKFDPGKDSEIGHDVTDGGEKIVLNRNLSERFLLGSRSDVSQNEQNELLTSKDVNKFFSQSFIKFIIGFLNSGTGGSIYWGLTKTGVVQGVFIERKLRDRLQVSIDATLKDITPRIAPGAVEIIYHNIYAKNYRHDLRIIEAKVKATTCHVYCDGTTDTAYIRDGPETREYYYNEVHRHQVEKEENRVLSLVNNLKQLIALKKKSLNR